MPNFRTAIISGGFALLNMVHKVAADNSTAAPTLAPTNNDDLSAGKIAGIAVGGIAATGILAALGIWLSCKCSFTKSTQNKDGSSTTETFNLQQGDSQAAANVAKNSIDALKGVAEVFHSNSSTPAPASTTPASAASPASPASPPNTPNESESLDAKILAAVAKDSSLSPDAAQLLEDEARVREAQDTLETHKAKFFLTVAMHNSPSATHSDSPPSASTTTTTVAVAAESHVIEMQHLGSAAEATH